MRSDIRARRKGTVFDRKDCLNPHEDFRLQTDLPKIEEASQADDEISKSQRTSQNSKNRYTIDENTIIESHSNC